MNSRVKKFTNIEELSQIKFRFEEQLKSKKKMCIASRPYYREMIADIEERIIQLQKH